MMVVHLNLYSHIKINFRKIQMIIVIEWCLWNFNFESFWEIAIISIHKIQYFLWSLISFTPKVETQSSDWHYFTKKGKIYTDLPEARATATIKQSSSNVLNILTLIFEWFDFQSSHFLLYREVVNDLLMIQWIDRIICTIFDYQNELA